MEQKEEQKEELNNNAAAIETINGYIQALSQENSSACQLKNTLTQALTLYEKDATGNLQRLAALVAYQNMNADMRRDTIASTLIDIASSTIDRYRAKDDHPITDAQRTYKKLPPMEAASELTALATLTEKLRVGLWQQMCIADYLAAITAFVNRDLKTREKRKSVAITALHRIDGLSSVLQASFEASFDEKLRALHEAGGLPAYVFFLEVHSFEPIEIFFREKDHAEHLLNTLAKLEMQIDAKIKDRLIALSISSKLRKLAKYKEEAPPTNGSLYLYFEQVNEVRSQLSSIMPYLKQLENPRQLSPAQHAEIARHLRNVRPLHFRQEILRHSFYATHLLYGEQQLDESINHLWQQASSKWGPEYFSRDINFEIGESLCVHSEKNSLDYKKGIKHLYYAAVDIPLLDLSPLEHKATQQAREQLKYRFSPDDDFSLTVDEKEENLSPEDSLLLETVRSKLTLWEMEAETPETLFHPNVRERLDNYRCALEQVHSTTPYEVHIILAQPYLKDIGLFPLLHTLLENVKGTYLEIKDSTTGGKTEIHALQSQVDQAITMLETSLETLGLTYGEPGKTILYTKTLFNKLTAYLTTLREIYTFQTEFLTPGIPQIIKASKEKYGARQASLLTEDEQLLRSTTPDPFAGLTNWRAPNEEKEEKSEMPTQEQRRAAVKQQFDTTDTPAARKQKASYQIGEFLEALEAMRDNTAAANLREMLITARADYQWQAFLFLNEEDTVSKLTELASMTTEIKQGEDISTESHTLEAIRSRITLWGMQGQTPKTLFLSRIKERFAEMHEHYAPLMRQHNVIHTELLPEDIKLLPPPPNTFLDRFAETGIAIESSRTGGKAEIHALQSEVHQAITAVETRLDILHLMYAKPFAKLTAYLTALRTLRDTQEAFLTVQIPELMAGPQRTYHAQLALLLPEDEAQVPNPFAEPSNWEVANDQKEEEPEILTQEERRTAVMQQLDPPLTPTQQASLHIGRLLEVLAEMRNNAAAENLKEKLTIARTAYQVLPTEGVLPPKQLTALEEVAKALHIYSQTNSSENMQACFTALSAFKDDTGITQSVWLAAAAFCFIGACVACGPAAAFPIIDALSHSLNVAVAMAIGGIVGALLGSKASLFTHPCEHRVVNAADQFVQHPPAVSA